MPGPMPPTRTGRRDQCGPIVTDSAESGAVEIVTCAGSNGLAVIGRDHAGDPRESRRRQAEVDTVAFFAGGQTDRRRLVEPCCSRKEHTRVKEGRRRWRRLGVAAVTAPLSAASTSASVNWRALSRPPPSARDEVLAGRESEKPEVPAIVRLHRPAVRRWTTSADLDLSLTQAHSDPRRRLAVLGGRSFRKSMRRVQPDRDVRDF